MLDSVKYSFHLDSLHNALDRFFKEKKSIFSTVHTSTFFYYLHTNIFYFANFRLLFAVLYCFDMNYYFYYFSPPINLL